MNLIDIAVVVLFLAVFTACFFSGFSRAVVIMVAMFLGLVAAGIFYGPLSSVLTAAAPSMTDWTADVTSFFAVALIVGFISLYLILWSFRATALRTRRVLEFRGGLIGLVGLSLMSVLLALVVVTTVVQVSDWTVNQFPVDQRTTMGARNSLYTSVLAASALHLSPYLYDAVGAWVPGGPPPILKPARG